MEEEGQAMSGWIVRRRTMSGRGAWALLLALLLPVAATAEKPVPTFELQVDGAISIGPDGRVLDYEPKSDLSPAIAKIVGDQVRSWTFEPVLVDGRPVIAETRLALELEAMQSGDDGYALRIARVWFGQPAKRHRMDPPRYPRSAVRARLGAKVVLVLKLDAQGNVIDVFPEQTSLTSAGKESVEEKWREIFEKASIAAAREWKFEITETVNGKPIESSVRIPVVFTLRDDSRRSDTRWQVFIPGPVHPLPWVDSESLATGPGRDALEDGELQPLSSRFKLKQDVVGKVL